MSVIELSGGIPRGLHAVPHRLMHWLSRVHAAGIARWHEFTRNRFD
jgi:hypothetical protein